MLKCNACGGTFEPVLPNGMLYFHVCPPLSVAELQAAIVAKTLTFNGPTQAAYDAAVAADVKAPPLPGTQSQVSIMLATLSVPRKNARNENVVPAADHTKPATIVSAGAGVTDLGAVAPAATLA